MRVFSRFGWKFGICGWILKKGISTIFLAKKTKKPTASSMRLWTKGRGPPQEPESAPCLPAGRGSIRWDREPPVLTGDFLGVRTKRGKGSGANHRTNKTPTISRGFCCGWQSISRVLSTRLIGERDDNLSAPQITLRGQAAPPPHRRIRPCTQ